MISSFRNFVLAAATVATSMVPTLSHAQKPPLRTAVDATFPPHAMTKLGGGLQGYNIEMTEELARRLGRKIEIEGIEWNAAIPGMNSGKYDFLNAPLTVTEERAKAMLFTEGYLDTEMLFVIAKDSPEITSLESLRGKTIAMNKGAHMEQWARNGNAERYGFKYDLYGTNADAVQAVLSGRAYANLAAAAPAGWAAKQNPALKASLRVNTGQVVAAAFPLASTELRAEVNNAIKCMKLDGYFVKLTEKWMGFTPGPNSSSVVVDVGLGVKGMPGYDPTPAPPRCGK